MNIRKIPPVIELDWGEGEAFALVPLKGTDFDRVEAERKRKEADRKESESKQLPLT